MRTALALPCLLAVGCAEAILAAAPQKPMPVGTRAAPANPAYKTLAVGLVYTDDTRAALALLRQGIAQAMRMNPSLQCDPDRIARELDAMFQANFKSVARLNRLEDAAPLQLDAVAVVGLFAEVGVMSGQKTRVELTVDLLARDRRLLERLRGAGVGEVPYPATSMMLDEAEAQALDQFTAAFVASQALVQLASATASPAAPVGDARSHHERALHSFDLGNFDDAIREWQAAYDLDPRPKVLFNLARCHQRRGQIRGDAADLQRAKHFYTRYHSQTNEDVTAELADLDRELARLQK